MDHGKCPTVKLIDAKTDQLGGPKTSGKTQVQHSPVAETCRFRGTWSAIVRVSGDIEQGLRSGMRERIYQLVVGLLDRNCVVLQA